MFVFIDESGDSGFELERGSSTFFVFTAIIFKDSAACEAARKGLHDLMEKLRCYPEFKFAKTSHKFRVEFFRRCLQSDISAFVSVLVVDKRLVTSQKLRSNGRYFYQYFCRLALQGLRDQLSEARIVIDGCGSKEMKRDFAAYLRRECKPNGSSYKSFEFADSKREILVQMADMFSGLCYRNRTETEQNEKSKKLQVIEDWWTGSGNMRVWEFGKRV